MLFLVCASEILRGPGTRRGWPTTFNFAKRDASEGVPAYRLRLDRGRPLEFTAPPRASDEPIVVVLG
jgi:hypothetical protein